MGVKGLLNCRGGLRSNKERERRLKVTTLKYWGKSLILKMTQVNRRAKVKKNHVTQDKEGLEGLRGESLIERNVTWRKSYRTT